MRQRGAGSGVPVARAVQAAGHRAWSGTDENWLGGGAAMWWSHPDAATGRGRLVGAGLEPVAEEFVPEGDGGHALFWARRPPG
ncbi:hypothetical protein ACFZB9_24950 [Kitasatospora sp. NPDC008050]|uniref:hypothetical protein n=1 Tax=Kitasatospora sp. NPDC008050 TaxID=3364021 RepID=UPI0036E7D876